MRWDEFCTSLQPQRHPALTERKTRRWGQETSRRATILMMRRASCHLGFLASRKPSDAKYMAITKAVQLTQVGIN